MNWKLWFLTSFFSIYTIIVGQLPFEIRQIPTDKPWVAITFDDGPTKYTESILKILKKHNAKASFFLQAKHVEIYPNEAINIYADGHSVGNHGYQHDHIEQKSPKELIQMIAKSQLVFFETFDFMPRFYRPAYSRVGQGQDDILGIHFQHLIRWSIDPQDWNKKNSSRNIIKHIMNNVNKGSIIILHETPKTLRLLPKLLKQLHKKNYTCVDLDRLVNLHYQAQKE